MPSRRNRVQRVGQRLERLQVVSGKEDVDVGERRGHAGDERAVALAAGERVHPDDACEPRAADAPSRSPSSCGIAALPAVGGDHDDGAARQRAAAPDVVEGLQVLADPGAPGPVGHGARGVARARDRVAADEVRRQARQARAERERLDVTARAHGGLQEHDHRARVRLHRARDVDEEDEPARHDLGRPPGALDRMRRRCASPGAACGGGRACVRRARPGCGASGGAATARRDRARRARERAAARRARSARSRARAAARRPTRRPRSAAPRRRHRRRSSPSPSSAGARRRAAASASIAARTSSCMSAGRAVRDRRARRALPEGRERGVEDLEVVAPRDDRAAQRPVDLVAVVEAHRVERAADRPAGGPGPTSSPASRRIRPNVTSLRTIASPTRLSAASGACGSSATGRSLGLGDQLLQPAVAHALEVLVVLEHASRGWRRRRSASSSLLAEGDERLRPVDRLGDARAPWRGRACADARRTRRPRRASRSGTPGHAGAHDRDLALERRVPDPVVEAAALERVVQLARAVRGEDHDRPRARR